MAVYGCGGNGGGGGAGGNGLRACIVFTVRDGSFFTCVVFFFCAKEGLLHAPIKKAADSIDAMICDFI